MSNDTRVAVVLLNWNGGEFTIPCLESLAEVQPGPQQAMVFDNGSTDGSPERIQQAFPDVTLVRSPRNLGFTGGCNTAIRQLLRTDTEFVWLLNNDTTVAPNSLAKLLDAARSDARIAAVTGKILLQSEPDRIWYAGSRLDWLRFTAPHRGQGQRDDGQHDRREYVPFVSGCCMLIRTDALRDIGLLRESFFAYFEDFDWCLRAKHRGWKLMYAPEARLWHRVSATTRKQTATGSGGTTTPISYYLTTRNHLFVIRLHASKPIQMLVACLFLVSWRLYISAGLVVLRRWDKLAAIWRGIRDGLVMRIN